MSTIIRALIVSFSLIFGLGTLTGCVAATPTQESTGQYVDSSGVTAKVKTQLINTQGIDSTDINVKTYKGVVQLNGFVDTAAQAQLAEQVASQVPGVQKVENNLQIRSSY